ncbi:MAG: hypothetical protein HRU01_02170 [Myxococcales bacterium]|nr:hypothetical protein [Myxococcales bacterium]
MTNRTGITSLVLDESGNPYIAYYDDLSDNLNLAKKTGGTWTVESIETTGNVGQYPSLALDLLGNPVISYLDRNGFDLKYAAYDGTAWNIETVDATDNVGHHTSLHVDSVGNIGISYVNATDRDLKFAFVPTTVVIPALSAGAKGLLVSLLFGLGYRRLGGNSKRACR